MRIAYIALRGVPLSDGIVQYTDDMASKLVKRGHQVTVYTSKRYGNKTGYTNSGYYIKTVWSIPIKFLEKLSITFFASVNQIFKKYDVVHYHAMGPSVFSFMARRKKRAVIVQSHGVEYNRVKHGNFAKVLLQKLEKWSINMPDEILCCSTALSNHFIEKYNKTSVVIHNSVGIPDLKLINMNILNDYDLTINNYYLFMARLSEEKGLGYLINAFKSVETNRELVIAGAIDKNNDFHKKIIECAKVNKRIRFIDNISGDIKDAILKGAYSFILPSEIEGFSIALLEAMSYQKCCIVSDIPNNLEAIDNTGLSFRTKDELSLERVIQFAEDHPKEVDELGKLARERIINNFSLDNTVLKTEDFYRKILARKGIKYE